MKPENTLENKAKFFALYWGQEVIKRKDFRKLNHKVSEHMQLGHVNLYLSLAPLSQISDEDAIEVAKAEFTFFDLSILTLQVIRERSKVYVSALRDGVFLAKIEVANPHKLNVYGIDIARSKGYALPWMGLSVKELIEYGWVVLKEEVSCK